MKKILILILVLSLLLCGCGKEELPEPTAVQTGQMPTQTEETAPETDPEETETVPGETEVADDGPEGIMDENDTDPVYRLVRKIALNEDGAELWRMEYDYDDAGFMTEERELSAAGQMLRQAVNTPGENGLCWKSEIYENGVLSQTVYHTYDAANRLTNRRTETAGTEDYFESWTYDDKGNELTFRSGIGEDPEELLNDWSYVYTYTEDGKVLTREEFFSGERAGRIETHYDDAGRVSETVYFHADGSVNYSTLSTWEGSTETLTQFDDADVAYMTTVTTYDGEGNILRQEVQQDGAVISCVEYYYEPFEIPAA